MLNQILVSLKDKVEDSTHPFFEGGKGQKELLIVITSDKGLCGGLNTNLLRKVKEAAGTEEIEYVTIGRKGALALSRLKKNVSAEFPVKDPATFAEIRLVGKFAQERFLTGEYSRVRVAFTNFVNTVTLVPTVEQLLPINKVTLGGKRNFEGMGEAVKVEEATALSPQYSFEPTPAEVFESILPQYVNNTLYQMLLEARASEHSSRMVAMKNATDNAKGLIKDLTLEYNKLRQASITNELLEITTAKLALE
jgi:F-type H+-transporting ATPase subunit gamma